MKEWTLIGIPLVISAVPHLAKATEEAHAARTRNDHTGPIKDEVTSSFNLTRAEQMAKSEYMPKQLNSETEEQGYKFMLKIYKHNLPTIMQTWGPHQVDFEWLEKRVIYGLHLSDHTILNEIEAELVTLSSIMAQGLRQPTLWHIRGLMRLGISADDTEKVCDVVKEVAKWVGKVGTENWIKASEVEVEMEDTKVGGL
jgi:hypothetical protein